MVKRFKNFSEARQRMWKAGHDKEQGHFFVKHSRTQERRGNFKTGREALDHSIGLNKEVAHKREMKTVKEDNESHDYKMTYTKSHTDGKGKITHHEYHHVTHKLPEKPLSPEGARGLISRTEKHQQLKSKGYKPHVVGSHDDKRTESYGRPVKHTYE